MNLKLFKPYFDDTQPRTTVRFHRPWLFHRPKKLYEKTMFKLFFFALGLSVGHGIYIEILKWWLK